MARDGSVAGGGGEWCVAERDDMRGGKRDMGGDGSGRCVRLLNLSCTFDIAPKASTRIEYFHLTGLLKVHSNRGDSYIPPGVTRDLPA